MNKQLTLKSLFAIQVISIMPSAYAEYPSEIITKPIGTTLSRFWEGKILDENGDIREFQREDDLFPSCGVRPEPTELKNIRIEKYGVEGQQLRWDCLITRIGNNGVPFIEERPGSLNYVSVCPYGTEGVTRLDQGTQYCYEYPINIDPYKNVGEPDPCMSVGNPMNVSSGNKFQKEIDYLGNGVFPLEFIRYYNSDPRTYGLKPDWTNTYSRSLKLFTGPSYNTASLRRPDGKVITFTKSASLWKGPVDEAYSFSQVTAAVGATLGYRLITSGGVIEDYDTSGRHLMISDRNGNSHSLSYSNGDGSLLPFNRTDLKGYVVAQCHGSALESGFHGALVCVTHTSGRALSFEYDDTQRLSKIIDPSGGEIKYAYGQVNLAAPESLNLLRNLTHVTYQDGGIREYLYGEVELTSGMNRPRFLTGIIDENGDRFATWNYDISGRVKSSEHGEGQDKYTISYTQNRTSVVDPLKTQYSITHSPKAWLPRSTLQTQAAGAGCYASNTSRQYDANGNVTSIYDVNGGATLFSYDMSRNLEINRTEAAYTDAERLISTEWHTMFDSPSRIAEPFQITNYFYDDSGNLIGKTVFATTDQNGKAGFTAAKVGVVREWTWKINSFGQLVEEKSPRGSVTSFEYDAAGNLVSKVNHLGHKTAFSQFDPHGNVQRIVDPNGLVTTYQYNSRQLVNRIQVGNEVTSMVYDKVGQLSQLTSPNNSTVYFKYDAAHRLVGLEDVGGNKITYTVNAAGGRTSERVNDIQGKLVRLVSRTFDALGRVQSVAGANR